MMKFSLNHLLKVAPGLFTLLPVVLFFTMLPLLSSINPLISIFIIAVLFWFILHSLGRVHLPGKFIRFILVIISLALLISQYGFLFSQKASMALLCLMLTLKFLEIKNDQDSRNIFIIIFLGYFILITHFLNDQDFFLSLYALANTFILTLLLIAFNRKPQAPLPLQTSTKLVTGLFIKALPFAIILFLFFPRIPGPLWSLPEDGQTSKTGISDKMYPGSVSELVDSDDIAFRVDFHSPLPDADKLYWRGPVLSVTDGFLWQQKKASALNKPVSEVLNHLNNPVQYTITLEPSHQKWLFALEMPISVSGDTIKDYFISQDLQIINKNNINQLTQYRVRSMTDFTLQALNKQELKSALYYPPNNPQTRQLGQQWADTFDNKEEIITEGLNYFKNQPFFYTKRPDIMVDNPADEFLFDKKRGFCEHYASSFVLLMRASGIPARVVTGYQGAEKNEVGQYYIVRQSNAHAWAEVWLENQGWLRVDPTTMIPANRIEADIFETNLDRLGYSSLNIPDLAKLSEQQKTALYQFGRQISQTMDNIKHSWNKWVLGYDKSQQSLLLKLMGFTANWQTLIILLISGIAMVFLLLYLLTLYQSRKKIDPMLTSYQKFLSKLYKGGLNLSNSMGPQAIQQRALIKFPKAKAEIIYIINLYLKIRYKEQYAHKEQKLFIEAVNKLKL